MDGGHPASAVNVSNPASTCIVEAGPSVPARVGATVFPPTLVVPSRAARLDAMMSALDDVPPVLDARVARLLSEFNHLHTECHQMLRGMRIDDEGDVRCAAIARCL